MVRAEEGDLSISACIWLVPSGCQAQGNDKRLVDSQSGIRKRMIFGQEKEPCFMLQYLHALRTLCKHPRGGPGSHQRVAADFGGHV